MIQYSRQDKGFGSRSLRVASLLLGIVIAVRGHATLSRKTDPQTGLKAWTFREGALSLALIQRLPDQTRGFFQGRGFSREAADRIARACVFQVIAGNQASEGTTTVLEMDLTTWRVRYAGQIQEIPIARRWRDRWESLNLSQRARLAFRWALFPTRQTFHPGDHHWGMVPFGPGPGESFALQLSWVEDGVSHRTWIPGIQCPKDRDP